MYVCKQNTKKKVIKACVPDQCMYFTFNTVMVSTLLLHALVLLVSSIFFHMHVHATHTHTHVHFSAIYTYIMLSLLIHRFTLCLCYLYGSCMVVLLFACICAKQLHSTLPTALPAPFDTLTLFFNAPLFSHCTFLMKSPHFLFDALTVWKISN